MNREQMLEQLRENTCVVTFTKKNGDERVMTCTLGQDTIPSEQLPTGNGNTQPNPDVVRCYDTEAEGWRSFIVDNVTNFEVQ